MEPFTRLTGIAVPLALSNVDTGMIVPGRFQYIGTDPAPGEASYASAFLHDLRFDRDGAPRPEFVLNQPAYAGASILVAGRDFGCGSSRESAAYAVRDVGFRAIVAPSFGDIFYGNCIQNGILPVVLPPSTVADLMRMLEREPGSSLRIDLPEQIVSDPAGVLHPFEVASASKERLLHGRDDVDVTLLRRQSIDAFESEYRHDFPWSTFWDEVK